MFIIKKTHLRSASAIFSNLIEAYDQQLVPLVGIGPASYP